MGSLGGFLFVYVLGGITFFPLILALILLHAYLTLPQQPPAAETPDREHADSIRLPSDDQYSLKSGTDKLAEKFQRAHESDVAAGYFAVCREYVPGGVNGKPPERTTPAGEVVAAESPSVYQSMYRSIFDRKQSPSIDPSKANGKNTKKSRNVFFVILRHGHLMLYDDAEQIEVRYVISLAHHDVSIYGGGGTIPEGELWLKRNAICLSRKPDTISETLDSRSSTLPFYLFSENLSEKEDFYFAILKNLEKVPHSPNSPPTPQHYDVKHIVTLVQRLHSSEEHLQTRWINALLGRLFLALYRTPEMEALVQKKITKKISRVKKPNFITRIALRSIDMGEGIPLITNPRLKDLTVDGDCCVEADVNYRGNFRMEIGATARIELGTRFKPREVDMVLAVVLNKLDGHGLLRFKPPPSNRAWISFETMPAMEMTIEPIVSSRQLTYSVILRAIESRIREVVAETLVQPFWDDIPFLDTEGQKFRGGIWEQAPEPEPTVIIPDETTEQLDGVTEAPAEKMEGLSNSNNDEDQALPVPTATGSAPPSIMSRRSSKSFPAHLGDSAPGSSSSVDKVGHPEPPRAIRAQTFSPAANPIVTADNVKVDTTAWERKELEKDAASTMMEISSRSPPTSPQSTPVGSPPNSNSFLRNRPAHRGSASSQESKDTPVDSRSETTRPRNGTMSSTSSSIGESRPGSSPSLNSETSMQNKLVDTADDPVAIQRAMSSKSTGQRQVIGSIGSAAAAAKKWGWNVLNRSGESSPKDDNRPVLPDHPIGRGRPLPPPGTPLPPPERSFLSKPITMPKRKPVPPPLLPERPLKEETQRPVPKPPLPKRPSVQIPEEVNHSNHDELLVIQAPDGSEPTTPVTTNQPGVGDEERRDAVEFGRPSSTTINSSSSSSKDQALGNVGDTASVSSGGESDVPLSASPAEETPGSLDSSTQESRT